MAGHGGRTVSWIEVKFGGVVDICVSFPKSYHTCDLELCRDRGTHLSAAYSLGGFCKVFPSTHTTSIQVVFVLYLIYTILYGVYTVFIQLGVLYGVYTSIYTTWSIVRGIYEYLYDLEYCTRYIRVFIRLGVLYEEYTSIYTT